MANAKKLVPLPPTYVRARRERSDPEIDLDWRAIAKREPRMWPGMLVLWNEKTAHRENERIAKPGFYFFGTNTAGLLFAFDAKGRVVLFDECEMDDPELLATSFDALERSFVTKKAKAGDATARAFRSIATRWARLDAILEGRHPLSRTANIEGVLGDIVSIYLVAREHDALAEALTSFAKRHPKKRALATKMRAYAKDWVTRTAPESRR